MRSSYPTLTPGQRMVENAGKCALAVMAKAPRPGKVKTRLAPPLTLEQSAALNTCFLQDTFANIGLAEQAQGIICYTPVGDEAMFNGLAPEGFALIAQRGDGFGERLHLAATDLLSCGYDSVCLIDSDSPTIPHAALQQAVEVLAQPGDRVVLGGSEDGGYYLIGLKAAHSAVFERITWSTAAVFAETLERAREAGLEVVRLPLWYDVDDGATLRILASELLDGQRPSFAIAEGFDAIRTREYLHSLAAGGVPPWQTRD